MHPTEGLEMSGQCFVMQRFDGARYDRLFDEIFDPAISSG
jgi:hypothetical protein